MCAPTHHGQLAEVVVAAGDVGGISLHLTLLKEALHDGDVACYRHQLVNPRLRRLNKQYTTLNMTALAC
jgi:hypothetical protein